MKIHNFLIITILFFSSCSNPGHIREADRITNLFNKKMKVESLVLAGSGGALMDNIKEISLDFKKVQCVDIEQSRLIYVKNVQALLHLINSDEKVRPYLNNYPFTIENVDFTIIFCGLDDFFALPPYIAHVSSYGKNGIIHYSEYNAEKDNLKTVYEESYEEALNIVNSTLK